jgi:hypothetical protein
MIVYKTVSGLSLHVDRTINTDNYNSNEIYIESYRDIFFSIRSR